MEIYRVKPDSLAHYGLQGMKWGRRRWQYEDGRFNEEGKIRYFGKGSPHRPPSVMDLQGDSGTKKPSESKQRNTGSAEVSTSKKTEKEIVSDSDRKKDYETKGKKASESVLSKFGKRSTKDACTEGTGKDLSLTEVLGVTDEEAAQIRKYAKIAGITLVTVAGIYAAGYLFTHRPQDIAKNIHPQQIIDHIKRPIPVGPELFAHGRVGVLAKTHGYDTVTASALRHAAENPVAREINYNELVRNVRVGQIADHNHMNEALADQAQGVGRRLSCWSAAHAYFMSAMTGGDYVSKSYDHLADFNSFNKLYTQKPEIFTVIGTRSRDFVGQFGKWGILENREATRTSKLLTKNIFKHISEANNLSADGTRTVGFIDGGYRKITCTHQWNFELLHNADGTKSLMMADGWAGKRWFVGTMAKNGKIKYNPRGLKTLAHEIGEYNADSLRFYAPKLSQINFENIAEVILSKI